MSGREGGGDAGPDAGTRADLPRRRLLQVAALTAAAGCSRGHPDRAADEPDRAASSTSGAGASSSTSGTGRQGSAPTARPLTHPVGAASEVEHGPRTVPAVALTFHGAGDPALARTVLDELERAGVHATVLAVGSWLDAEPVMARRVLDGGHELGNHTYRHLPMRRLAAAAAYEEVARCAGVLQRLAGSRGRWFRASGTQHTTAVIRAVAARAGYARCLSYDVDSLDWTDPGPAAVTRTVLAGAVPGSIVSLHLGHQGTAAALPALIDALRRRELRPVTMSELLA